MMLPRRTSPARAALVALAALLLAGPGVAAAQDAAPASKSDDDDPAAFAEEFERADTNKDGKLSEDEARKAGFFTTDESFKGTDRDGDGVVTLFELGDALQKRLRQWSSDGESADTDGDGFVSREEAQKSGSTLAEVFMRVDRDGDGRIHRDEYDTYTRGAFYSETGDPGVVPNIINKKF